MPATGLLSGGSNTRSDANNIRKDQDFFNEVTEIAEIKWLDDVKQ